MQETHKMRVPSLGWEYPLEEKMAMYSSILVLRIPWAEEPGRPQSIVSQRVGHDWGDLVHTHLKYSWCTILYVTGAQYSGSQPLKVLLRLEAGFPGGSDGNKSACNAGDLGLIRGLGRSPREGKGCPFQYSGLENSHGQRSLAGYSPWGRKELSTTEQLSTAHIKLIHSVVQQKSAQYCNAIILQLKKI